RHGNAVYGIYQDEKLSYILYTDAVKIIQVKGFANKTVPYSVMSQIQEWFELYFCQSKTTGYEAG
ncbi:MAG: hypothetical protein ACQERD_12035, partial [Campylobacterota bacterium]